MKYCKRCILPNTRPGLIIETDGVCNACKGHDEKLSFDWDTRARQFSNLLQQVKLLNRPFDCIVPVSGGKDSTYQVVKCLEHDLHVLAITWKTPSRTEIGQKNLENLISLGVDHIDYSVNPDVEREFTYKALLNKGSVGVPMHFGLYIIPLRFAVALNVPLVVWGESPYMEYGGSQEQRCSNSLDRTFLISHGILQGTMIEDWIDTDLDSKDLEIYKLPTEEEFSRVGLQSIFIGYYFNWSPQESLEIALKHGFKVRDEGPKVGYYNFADIDCDLISVHHYFKWLKYGFTRLFDNLSLEIRNGNISREQAVEIVRKTGEQVPYDDIERLCEFLRISEQHFWEIAEKFRNTDIWHRERGTWILRDFLIEDWHWR
ncbi:MAG: N-acetyl sugar amidotransferase [Deltaproteobacteria bacterium]|nr:N-acetyl sugar amidotransferase [Deltaproteobacteria bacterium]